MVVNPRTQQFSLDVLQKRFRQRTEAGYSVSISRVDSTIVPKQAYSECGATNFRSAMAISWKKGANPVRSGD